MKNLLFTLALLISFGGYAQEKRIQVTSKNPTFPPQYVVVEKATKVTNYFDNLAVSFSNYVNNPVSNKVDDDDDW